VRRRAPTGYETGRDDLDLMIELDAMKWVQAAAVSLSTTGDYESMLRKWTGTWTLDWTEVLIDSNLPT
jgi:hypothetical protein